MTNNLTTTYSWNAAGQLLTTTVAGQHTAVYTYDQRGNLTLAVTNGLTTTFVYNGHNQRLQLSVNGQPTTYLLDYARGGNRVLQESNALQTKFYLYGDHCLAELVETDNPERPEQRYYLYDGSQTVRQTVNEQAEPTYAWTFSPEGAVLLGEEGPVSHLSCVGDAVYDWSTGLIFKGGKYYDPRSDLWLTFGSPAVVWAVGRWYGSKRKDKKQDKRFFWLLFLLLVLFVLAGCQNAGTPTPGLPATMAPKPTETCTPIPTSTPESIPALPPPVMLDPTSAPTQQPTKTVSPTLTPTNTQLPPTPSGGLFLSNPFKDDPYWIINLFKSEYGYGAEIGGHNGLDLVSNTYVEESTKELVNGLYQASPLGRKVFSPVTGVIKDSGVNYKVKIEVNHIYDIELIHVDGENLIVPVGSLVYSGMDLGIEFRGGVNYGLEGTNTPHLHLGVFDKIINEYVDPKDYLDGAQTDKKGKGPYQEYYWGSQYAINGLPYGE